MLTAEINEEKSNQILDFTREIKNADSEFKIKITETLWSIIYSNKEEDMYESNLMRRLSGLLYLDNKIVGDIKEKIKAKFAK
jgi:Tellurite resistance protein TerB.